MLGKQRHHTPSTVHLLLAVLIYYNIMDHVFQSRTLKSKFDLAPTLAVNSPNPINT